MSDNSRHRHDDTTPLALCLTVLAIGVLWLGVTVGCLALTVLKETPAFWTNDGGYPIALREAVLAYYYPVLSAVLTLQLGATLGCVFALFYARSGAALIGLFALAPAWLISFIAVGVLIANNLWNVLNDQPLHWHPE
ncbi:hypothetical protein [Cerasicoccus fimbriatus]|uniref:hypothetical protein n=1 Tax=Cerasicoccus fimbriatus TaxID=3014554 RepID=UPI0022B3BBD2|nr:hypothetical protein [Cerasicoccus sp. TK19100]